MYIHETIPWFSQSWLTYGLLSVGGFAQHQDLFTIVESLTECVPNPAYLIMTVFGINLTNGFMRQQA